MAEQASPFDSGRAPAVESAGSEGTNGTLPADERSGFLDAMAHAMQETLGDARTRVAEDVERRRVAHIAAINARREVEASRICELADEDRKAIGMWAASERLRIQFERERRTAGVEADLESSLAEHRSKIDQEIELAEAAIAAHRAELDEYFATLRHLTDPVAIAQHAARRPPFPTFERITAGAVAVSPDVTATEVPAPAAVQMAQEQPAAAAAVAQEQPAAVPVAQEQAVVGTTAPAEPAARVDAPAVAVMDEVALKRAQWWAMWTALPEPPAEPAAGQADRDRGSLEAIGVGADPNESDPGAVRS